jgi:hypothetical protein
MFDFFFFTKKMKFVKISYRADGFMETVVKPYEQITEKYIELYRDDDALFILFDVDQSDIDFANSTIEQESDSWRSGKPKKKTMDDAKDLIQDGYILSNPKNRIDCSKIDFDSAKKQILEFCF